MSLPVSIHQPVRISIRTTWPWSISHWMASVISSSPRSDGSIAATASWMTRVEEVHADERQVGRRVGRLLDEVHDVARRRRGWRCRTGAGSGTCLSRICADGGSSPSRGPHVERVDERGEVLLEHVVAEVHDEVVVAEEVAGDQHAVRQTERPSCGM